VDSLEGARSSFDIPGEQRAVEWLHAAREKKFRGGRLRRFAFPRERYALDRRKDAMVTQKIALIGVEYGF
jgi:hypothetical protein